MLVLSRKEGQRIRIGPAIWITVVEVCRGKKVRIGIECPREIPIYREELLSCLPEKSEAEFAGDRSQDGLGTG